MSILGASIPGLVRSGASGPVIPTDASVAAILTAPRTVYLSADGTGNDANTGLSAAQAWATLPRVNTDLANYAGGLAAVYLVIVTGTGNVTNATLTLPPKLSGGAFKISGRDSLIITGFVCTAGTGPGNVNVAAGLGTNTYRGNTVRFMTGAAAAAGTVCHLQSSIDTQGILSTACLVPPAVGDSFRIERPAARIVGSATWRDVVRGNAQTTVGAPTVPTNTIHNLGVDNTITFADGGWYVWGVEEGPTGVLNCAGGSVQCGDFVVITTAQADIGQVSTEGWRGWGVAKLSGTTTMLAASGAGGYLGGYFVGPVFVDASGFIQSTQVLPRSLPVYTNWRGGSVGHMSIKGRMSSVPQTGNQTLGGWATGHTELMRVQGQVSFQAFSLAPEASHTAWLRTYGNAAHADVVQPMIGPSWGGLALTNAASIAVDNRNGGQTVFGATPNVTGVLGDAIADPAAPPTLNAAFAVPGFAIGSAPQASSIMRAA